LKDGLSEADRHQEGALIGESSCPFGIRPDLMQAALPSLTADEDLLEWPKYIDLD
jgi:hypothetical protein